MGATTLPDRRTLAGEPFAVESPDAWLVIGMFEAGQLLRLSCNFYVQSQTVPRAIEFDGDIGSLRLDDWIMPGASSSQAAFGEAYVETKPAVDSEVDWCLGVADLAAAMRENRPHRITGEHAAHVVEVLEAINAAAASGNRVHVASSFPNPLADLS